MQLCECYILFSMWIVIWRNLDTHTYSAIMSLHDSFLAFSSALSPPSGQFWRHLNCSALSNCLLPLSSKISASSYWESHDGWEQFVTIPSLSKVAPFLPCISRQEKYAHNTQWRLIKFMNYFPFIHQHHLSFPKHL